MTFKNYLTEERMDEALITFGNRPRSGQIIILAGGAGSGKGFTSKKLIGVEGKWLDVDHIKDLIIHPGTPKLNAKIKKLYGIDVADMDLTNPKDVEQLHIINDEMGISKKIQAKFFDAVGEKNKPNVIFDSTGKSEKKIQDIVDIASKNGYKKENMHIIWVMTPHEEAKENNLNPGRGRVVPEEILNSTHLGVSHTMQNLMRNSRFQEFINGYVYIVFNKKYVDNTIIYSKFGGSYMDDALILTVKKKGKKQIPYSNLADNFLSKIKKYVPKDAKKLWESYRK